MPPSRSPTTRPSSPSSSTSSSASSRSSAGARRSLSCAARTEVNMASAAPKIPQNGQPIELKGGRFSVPDQPIIPFIEGDGTGPDIWRASQYVFDNAVKKVYGGKKKIAWREVFAGEKPFNQWKTWLPDETVEAFREFLVGIKGPLTTPIGGGIRCSTLRCDKCSTCTYASARCAISPASRVR